MLCTGPAVVLFDTTAVVDDVQPFKSDTVTVYVPAVNDDVADVAAPFDHRYEYIPDPPVTITDADPLLSAVQFVASTDDGVNTRSHGAVHPAEGWKPMLADASTPLTNHGVYDTAPVFLDATTAGDVEPYQLHVASTDVPVALFTPAPEFNMLLL